MVEIHVQIRMQISYGLYRSYLIVDLHQVRICKYGPHKLGTCSPLTATIDLRIEMRTPSRIVMRYFSLNHIHVRIERREPFFLPCRRSNVFDIPLQLTAETKTRAHDDSDDWRLFWHGQNVTSRK